MDSKRRTFLKTSAVAGSGMLVATNAAGAQTPGTPAEVRAYRRLGRTGLKISDISMGTSRLREGEEHLVHHALDRGINYFDTAESYTSGASETVIGKALKGKRDDVYLVSKTLTSSSTSAASMMADLDGSLRRLQTDYVDIYMNHAVNSVDVVGNPSSWPS